MSATAAATVADALAAARDAIAASGSETPRLDAELLLAEAAGRRREQLAADPGAPVSPAAARVFGAMVRRRVAHEPVAYILGRRGFRRIELRTDRRALIPRPETELLVEVALDLAPRRVLDVGTGSGAVALAVADELPGAEVVAVETDRRGAGAGGRERRRARSRRPRRAPPRPRRRGDGAFDLALANLPYVADGDRRALPADVADWEPEAALFAGPDGLAVIRAVLAALEPGGSGPRCDAVALEVGIGQAEDVDALVRAAGYPDVATRADLAGIDRVVVGRR